MIQQPLADTLYIDNPPETAAARRDRIGEGLAHLDRLAQRGSLGYYELKPRKRFAFWRWLGVGLLFVMAGVAGFGGLFAIWATVN